MKDNYIESIDPLFEDKDLSLDALQGFMDESFRFILDLQKNLASPDEKVREQAIQSSLQMKEKLEAKLKGVCEKNGIDPNQLGSLMENEAKMGSNDQKIMQEMEQQFQTFSKGNS